MGHPDIACKVLILVHTDLHYEYFNILTYLYDLRTWIVKYFSREKNYDQLSFFFYSGP